MLTGGPDIPYPRGCPQDCHLGPEYAQGQPGWVPWIYEVLDMAETPVGGALATTINADYPMSMGIYPPTQIWDTGCTGGDEIPDGVWVGSWITLTAGQANSVPARQYYQAQWLVAVAQPTGGTGTGYALGEELTLTDGTPMPGTSGPTRAATLVVTSLGAGNSITGVAITAPGAYYNGYTPSGAVSGSGTGASLSLTFGGALRNLGGICQKRGAKAVAGQRWWHGMFGYIDSVLPFSAVCFVAGNYLVDGVSQNVGFGCAADVDNCPGNFVNSEYQSAAPQTKYLEIYATSTNGVYDADTGDLLGTSTYNSDFVVNALSGVLSGSGTTSIYAPMDEASNTLNFDQATQYLSGYDINTIAGDFAAFLTGPPDPIGDFPNCYAAQSGSTYTCNQGDATVFLGNDYLGNECYGTLPDYVIETVVCDLAGGNFSRTETVRNYIGIPVRDGDGNIISYDISYADQDYYIQTVTVTNTEITNNAASYYIVSSDPDTGLPVWVQDGGFSASATLKTPNYASDVYDDVTATLLNEWLLDDDLTYPWRTEYLQIMPLVSRNEQTTRPPFVDFDTSLGNDLTDPITDADGHTAFSEYWTPTYGDWLDLSSYTFLNSEGLPYDPTTDVSAAYKSLIYDGSILGAPLPAGYQGYFDFKYIGWKSDFTCTENYGIDALSFNTVNNVDLPWNTTQFTDASFAGGNPLNGASIEFANGPLVAGTLDDVYDSLVIIKSAEIVEKWSAQNWGRPAGMDKFLVNEYNGDHEVNLSCVTGAVGDGVGAVLTLSPPTTAASGIWGYWNSGSSSPMEGFYNATVGGGGTTVTLNSLAYSVPNNWAPLIPDGAAWAAPLRFPGAPALLGRVAVTTAAPVSGVVTFTWQDAQPQFGMAPGGTESVTIYGLSMNELGTEIATRYDDSTFKITTATDYSTAAWVMITGAPAWYFNTSYPRGKFVTLEWFYDLRTTGEITRLTGQTDCSGDPLAMPDPNLGYASFSQTQQCLPFIDCSPRVVCWTPNSETFGGDTHAVVMGLPGVSLDARYGTRWAGALQSTMTDYFSQTPHEPCDGTPLVEDNGTCEADIGVNYGVLPMVEAEIWPPGTGGTAGYGFSQAEPPAVTNNEWPDPTTNADGPSAPSNGQGGPGGSEYVLRGNLMANYEGCWDYADWFLP